MYATKSYTALQATAVKKGTSPSFLTVVALSTKSSPTANLNLSQVAGESNPHSPGTILAPFMPLAALTASLSAKNTVHPKNNGGSPMPLLLCTLLRWFQLKLFPSLSCRKREALKTCGMSLKPGILYVPGPRVKSCPEAVCQRDSSIVKRPWPWMNAPSIWP
jgi:hypothetical protein